jgi:RNA polymerase sigma-70 factor (ECF subfamily)
MGEDGATQGRPVTRARYLAAEIAELRPGSSPIAAVEPIVFTQLFREFGRYVPGLLRRLGVAEREVEDVAQDVFTVIHRKLPQFRGESSLKTWICGIALRVARSHLRLSRVRKLMLGDPPVEPSREPVQLEALALAERVRLLQRALDALPEKLRRVFVLYELEELSIHEVAALIGRSEKTAYTRLYAARDRVERSLRRQALIGGDG